MQSRQLRADAYNTGRASGVQLPATDQKKRNTMQIKGKVYCLFEQSGTFKNELKKIGYSAYDYDIQNNHGETDHVIDLFAEIEKAYTGGGGVSLIK